jgi:hypothetical protein
MYRLALDSSLYSSWYIQGSFGMDEIREFLCVIIQRSIGILILILIFYLRSIDPHIKTNE